MNALSVIEKQIGNVEAEMGIISAALCEARVVDSLADTLAAEDFSDPFLGHVYGLIVREHSLGRPVNPVTVRPYLEQEPAFRELGGLAWLADLTASSMSVMAAKGNAQQVRDFAARRRLIEGLREAIDQAGDLDRDVEESIAWADDVLSTARDGERATGEHSGADCVRSVIEKFDEPVTGVECGTIPSIDKLLGPIRPGHFVVGAGRPGMGKTATAISYAIGAARNGHGVLFVSLEMGAEELGERMAADLCAHIGVPYSRIRDRSLSPDQKREVCRAFDEVQDMPLQIVDRSGLRVSQLRTMVKRWKRRMAARGQSLELVIVDYLQLMRPDRKADRYEAITEISQALKEIAKEHKVGVFALSQLSRAVEQRADKRPMLSDLRESGQIEQDADAVLFFLRAEYYLRLVDPRDDAERIEWESALERCRGQIEFICAKRRNGATGSLTGEFRYEFQAVRG
jgi:replicative DNA helicase